MPLWQSLVTNLALSTLPVVVWVVIGESTDRLSPRSRQAVFALIMTLGALVSMRLATAQAGGSLADVRSPALILAGLFGGPLCGLAVGALAGLYRLTLGGTVWIGEAIILVAVLIGLAGARQAHRHGMRYELIALLAGGHAIALLALRIVIDGQGTLNFADIWPVIAVNAVATVLLGALLLQVGRRRDLLAANAIYRTIVDAMPDCLNMKDLDGRFVMANPATARLMHADSVADLIGKTDFDFYPAELARQYAEDEHEAKAKGHHTTIEQIGLLPDNTMGWLSTLKVPFTDADGHLIGLITHNRDITVTKRLQIRLQQINDHLDVALDNMSDGLAIYDADRRLILANNRYRSFFPKTAHLRVPGVALEHLIRAAVDCGEDPLKEGETLEGRIAARRAGMLKDRDDTYELKTGVSVNVRTTLLPNGCVLRMLTDVTEQRRFQLGLEHKALHDDLTGLPNRAYFNRQLAQLHQRAVTGEGELVVMLMDLDRFKQVNDTHGHAAGDALLRMVATRASAALRQGDFIARFGGDEFALLMFGPKASQGASRGAERVLKQVGQPMNFGALTLLPSATIGYAVYPRDSGDVDTLLSHADSALYAAKAAGRGTWRDFGAIGRPSQAALGRA